jgi:plastocyanin
MVDRRDPMKRRILLVVVLALWPVVLLPAAPAAAGGHCADVTSGHSASVDLKGLCIFPTLVRVPSGGGEVTFTNYDEVTHVIVGAGYAWGSDGTMHHGDSFTASFTRDGVYPFQCYLHPGMSGAILVGDANGRGAASSGGVTVPMPSNVAVTPSPATVPEAVRTTSGLTPWWLFGLGALVLATTLAIALRRPRVRGSNVTADPPGA